VKGMIGRLSFTGLAVAGVVLGHALAYGIAVGDADLRHTLLAETGHGYWMTAVAAAIVLGLVATAGRIGRLLIPRREAGAIGARFVARLAAAQVALFLLLETGERLTVGASVTHFFGDHLLTLGVVLQVGTAFLVSLALRLVGRAAVVIAAALARPPLASARARLRPPAFLPLARPLLAGARTTRGPPSL